jgi:peptidoglycan/xylan/chitin deacetylase (PgdA/CDA1 family)
MRRLALKVDCDTFEGTKIGIPNLIRVFEKFDIRASFFFTLGPDRSGRAIRRIFTQKGFLKKMLRSNAVSLYGPKTILYGTLLPAPQIGNKLKREIHSVAEAGHEVGVHGWDHVRWHDQLDQLSRKEIEQDYSNAHIVFEEIFGRKARASAAPGWHSTPTYLEIQENYNLLYSSNTRRGAPHFPSAGYTQFKTLEIPTTLPTWDESLASHDLNDPKNLLSFYSQAIKATEVHTLHTEVEGMSYLSLFEEQLHQWRSEGISFITLEDYATELLQKQEQLPAYTHNRIEIPNRGGFVSSHSG